MSKVATRQVQRALGFAKRNLCCGYFNNFGKYQDTKKLLDAFYRDLPRQEYDVYCHTHEKRVIYTGVLNLYTAYYREGISIEEIFARGDVYGFKSALDFAEFASKLGLGAIALCCSSGDKTSKYNRECLLEDSMTTAILFCTE